ncbi:hypothetical protein [Spirosoma areae]
MPKLTKAALKALFTTGKKPKQQDFFDLIDSMVHLDDQTAVDQQVVNAKISTYDTALKARQPDGVVSTLGDVFKVLEGYSDTRFIHNELKWIGLPGRPDSLNLEWTQQTIVTDEGPYNPLGSAGSPGSGPSQRWLGSTVAGLTGAFLVNDIKTDRRWVETGVGQGYYADRIIAMKVAITIKTNL